MMNLIPFRKSREIFSVPTTAWVDRFFEDFSPLSGPTAENGIRLSIFPRLTSMFTSRRICPGST